MLSDIHHQDTAVSVLQRFVGGYLKSPLLLVGTEGVGKRTSAVEAIKEILIKDRGPKSPEVRQLELGVHSDVTFLATEGGKDIGVSQAREAVDLAQNYPSSSPFKFFIVDGADHMTSEASNCLLKTLEDLPARSRFFLVAESYSKVLPTIRGRCSRVDYKPLPEGFIFSRLSKLEEDSTKALTYTRLGCGSLGKAIRLWSSGRIALRDLAVSTLKFGIEGDYSSMFATVDEAKGGEDLLLVLLRLVVQDLLTLPTDSSRILNVDISETLCELATHCKLWSALHLNLKQVEERNESAYIKLPFHIKSALIDAFISQKATS